MRDVEEVRIGSGLFGGMIEAEVRLPTVAPGELLVSTVLLDPWVE